MLDKLIQVMPTIPDLLKDESEWNSLRVDYNHPHVDRLWRQIDPEHRLLLHRIHPCETDQALLHPHPWPSAVHVIGDLRMMWHGYETGVGYGDPLGEAPPLVAKFVLKGASSYEMLDKNAWHYVRPTKRPIYTIMLIGKPFDTKKQDRFGQLRQHSPLDDETKGIMLKFFRGLSSPS